MSGGSHKTHWKHRQQLAGQRKTRREERGQRENKKRLARLAEIEAERHENGS